jgi:phosphatidylserine/phosphatidylglycerophosphate/cardiolipin synthase-like enzyme
MGRALIVLPDDSAKPILAAIEGAARTLRVKMFVFSDPSLLKAVIAAKRRGVKVRVMLNPARRSGEHDNDATRKALEQADVEVKDANPATTRDHDVAEIVECFEADWHRHAFAPRHKTHLVWCPGPGRDRICQFIDEARHRLFVQNERYQDLVIIERLVRAARRGVKVEVMARPAHTLKKEKLVEGVTGLRIMDDVGIKVRKLKHLKLHGKVLLADGVAAIVGSINFAAGSLDGRRELAIEVRDDSVVERLQKSPGTTRNTRTRSISRTTDCWPTWTTASRAAPSSSASNPMAIDAF